MFRPTLALMSKASRAPLTSKQANKNFYKGTGSFPGLGPKRQGRHGTRSKAPYILMPERMRTFVVPPALDQSDLRPYVAKAVKIHEHQDSWPMADSKPDKNSRKGGTFGPRGFDGEYYIQLARFMKEQENAKR
ncbi:Homoserine dehydrogenase [Microbotryomycetes sp. JL201]|nr:Homoserine dehydrogenase [Microbotryomycetes sp. JL201]